LARVSIVDWNGTCLLDSFVKVKEPVTDYRTFVSGVTKEDIESKDAMVFGHVRAVVRSLLRGKILIGHALKNDLAALQLEHPWYDTRDTAKYKPFMKKLYSSSDGKNLVYYGPRKLKEIVYENLGMTIQQDGTHHSSIEDSVSALLLYKKVRMDWEKVMEYKVYKTKLIQQEGEILVEEQKLDHPCPAAHDDNGNHQPTPITIPTYKSILGHC